MVDQWSPPAAPPALWLCMRAGSRFLLIAILFALLLSNVSLSWMLSVLLLPPLYMLVPLSHDPIKQLLQQREQQLLLLQRQLEGSQYQLQWLKLRAQQLREEANGHRCSSSSSRCSSSRRAAQITVDYLELEAAEQQQQAAALQQQVEQLEPRVNQLQQQVDMLQQEQQEQQSAGSPINRKIAAATIAGLLLLWLCDFEWLRGMRAELFEGVESYIPSAAETLSSSKYPSPQLLLQWLGSGVLQQQLLQQYPMPFDAAAAVAAGDAAAPAFAAASSSPAAAASAAAAAAATASRAAWSAQVAAPSPLLQQEQHGLLLRLLQPLLPRRPSSLLLLLYSLGRDAACIGSSTFLLLICGLLPLVFIFFLVLLMLPP
ncbi:hypothetical protein EBH_0079840 [Eimeria brunetti]|uniref:Uncharacterized protein n=1 Tax=Eimeria brunetti TaxID=51314 RepID=U6LJB6_9EIME|nr:hypothetical protein EBH_0079840 [Eimeria brunetti]